MSVIGRSVRRVDALGKVTGQTLFPGDINKPNQAYMKILFAGRPHAIIKSLDTSRAESIEGVLGVFTAKDVPVNEYGLIMPDQPVLCGPGSTKPHADRVRFVGDQVALVVAESEEIASEAVRRIEIEYEDLPLITDPLTAMEEESILLHPDKGSNVFCHYRIRKGDVERAFSDADIIVETEYSTPVQEHAYLQPEAGLGYIDDEGRITIEVAGQWAHEDQDQIAHALGLAKDQVRVIYPAIGGAFGGREDMSIQIVLALAVWRLHQRGINRPVKIIWSREESILGHHKRHAFIIRAKWGATTAGEVIAAEMEVIQDGGAYAYTSTKVLGNATLMCTGPYEIPNVKVDAYSVYTNHLPGGAMRGFGGPQGAFAAESQMNKLAEKLGIDPVEIRVKNVLRENSLLSVGTPLPPGVTIGEVVEKAAEGAGWVLSDTGWQRPDQAVLGEPSEPYLKRGLGFACGFKNVGFSFGAPEQCWATIELHGGAEIEEVVLHHAGAEVGQGAHTVMIQMAAEALGVPMEMVRIIISDTAVTEDSGSASASRLTLMAGNAIRGAAKDALEKWKQEERPAVSSYQYRPPATTPYDPQTGKSEPNFAYGYVAEAASVEVDVETGQVRLLEIICVDDVGKAINPQLVQGQIEGAVVQAAGYTLLEDFQQEDGYVQTALLSTYLIPTVLDIPDRVESVILEHNDPVGPWGARGVGEMPYIPLAPAVVAAIRDAVGVWFHDFPLTPERVLRGLRESGKL
ncbi:MAG: xanthine dehydrogenase family protein molybdopterin-binding subunit [Anaerolineaceae bacterium]|nr:MAG: xanthine dehydrogenase family protein molybdopterin-binding subunit [Anaerolineaceae bacterium]